MKKIYSVLFIILAASAQLSAQCMLTPISLTERVNKSSLIVEGIVISQKSFWNDAHNYIFTSNLVQVKQVLKGSGKSNNNLSYIEVITLGGTVDDRRISVEPSLVLNIGQEGVFTLNSKSYPSQYGRNTFETYADEQGFIKFDTRDNSARDHFNTYASINDDLYAAIGTIMNTKLPAYYAPTTANSSKLSDPSAQVAAITAFAPTSISAGTGSILTITGTGFGAGYSATNYVEFKNADDGGATFIGAALDQYVSWSNTQIQVKVPTRTSGAGTAGTGQIRVTTPTGSTLSATSLTVNYGHLNVCTPSPTTAASITYNTRHVNDNGSGGYTWRYSSNFTATPAAINSFTRAITTWTCGTYINWTIGTPTTIIVCVSDGVNIVRFDDAANPLPAGVLGRCGSYWSGCGTNPNMNWFVTELDIEFDNATNWQYGPANATGSQIDFESVAVHELGHGHQLSHVINTNDVMHYSIGPAQNKRILNVDDLNGGNAVMTRNLSGGVCSQPVMIQMSSASCTTLVPTASFVVTPTLVCTGQVVSLTDQSTNGPNTWTWTLTGGTPASSNAQNPTVTYATAGTKTITLSCSNANGASTPYSTTISVLASPTVVVGSASICPTKCATLTATGATTYTWNPGALVGATQNLCPASTTPYTIIGSNGTCTSSATSTVTVLPGANPSVANATVCAGSSTVMTATGATTYTWNPGNLTGASQTLSPASTTTYTVVGTVGTCTGQTTFVISTTTVLNGVNVTPSVVNICAGAPTTFTASGATTYTWNPGNLNGTTQTLSPMTTTNYTLTGKTGSCTGTKTFVINTTTVLAGVSVSPSNMTLCVGQTTVLTASGATTYTWNTSATGNTLLASPSASTVYVVTGQTGNCQGTANSTITVATCNAIAQNSNDLVSSIYPNPTQGNIIVKFASAFTGEITVYNAIGQLIKEKKVTNVGEYQLDIADQPNGVYMLKLKTNGNMEKIMKVIKE